jgi:phospholipase/carboxylesterase
MLLTGPEIPAPSVTPKQLIVFLHGWGADGENLIGLAGPLSLVFPQAHFLAPNAPEPCEVGGPGYQWFSLMDRSPESMQKASDSALPALQSYLDHQLKRFGLTEQNLALVGFSQGTMMALYAALRRKNPLAAVVGFSGALIGAETLPAEMCSKPPVCLIHGTEDYVVPFMALEHAQEHLLELDVPVETHAREGLEHAIDEEGLSIAIRFLQKHLQ